MRILLTGASGFIGKHLAKNLLKMKHDIVAPVRSSTDRSQIPFGCEIVTVDLFATSDFESHLENIDVVFHIAGAIKASSSEEFDMINAGITTALANATKKVAPKALFIFMSSQAAAGPDGNNPLSSYGKSKLLAEQSITKLDRYIIVRSPAALGSDDPETEAFYNWARRGVTISLGNSNLRFCAIAISDLVDFLTMLLNCPKAVGHILQPSLPNLVSWGEIHKALEKALNRKIIKVHIPSSIVILAGTVGEMLSKITGKLPLLDKDKARDITVSWNCEQHKVEQLVNWKPRLNLDETIKLSVRN